jgi:hypothetical protein
MSNVDHPDHYQGNSMEVIDIIEAFELDFHIGNVVKYILRAGKKGNALEDYNKALWYLERKIAQVENGFYFDDYQPEFDFGDVPNAAAPDWDSWFEDDHRMDIIGRNGNDGEHYDYRDSDEER